MKFVETITHSRLTQVLSYDPETGLFRWKERLSRRIHIGDIAGTLNKKENCIHIKIDKVHYLAQRLAWFYVTKVWPDKLVDHRNRIRTDNRFSNLRLATPAQNQHNRATPKGYKWDQKRGLWVATVRANYKLIYLGAFKEERDARAAYLAGCIKYHGPEWSENKEATP